MNSKLQSAILKMEAGKLASEGEREREFKYLR